MDIEKQKEMLLSYSGISPCPNDFESFWCEMKDKAESLELNAVLEPAEYTYKNAEAFHLYRRR